MSAFPKIHVVPAAELVSAAVERADLLKAEVPVELLAVSRQILILDDRVPDAGVQVQDAHRPQPRLQRLVERAAVTLSLRAGIQIDGQLTGVPVCRPADEGTRIGVPLRRSVLLRGQIRRGFLLRVLRGRLVRCFGFRRVRQVGNGQIGFGRCGLRQRPVPVGMLRFAFRKCAVIDRLEIIGCSSDLILVQIS